MEAPQSSGEGTSSILPAFLDVMCLITKFLKKSKLRMAFIITFHLTLMTIRTGGRYVRDLVGPKDGRDTPEDALRRLYAISVRTVVPVSRIVLQVLDLLGSRWGCSLVPKTTFHGDETPALHPSTLGGQRRSVSQGRFSLSQRPVSRRNRSIAEQTDCYQSTKTVCNSAGSRHSRRGAHPRTNNRLLWKLATSSSGQSQEFHEKRFLLRRRFYSSLPCLLCNLPQTVYREYGQHSTLWRFDCRRSCYSFPYANPSTLGQR
jgi:hypothetical protein